MPSLVKPSARNLRRLAMGVGPARLISGFFLATLACTSLAAQNATFFIAGEDHGAWPGILTSIGMVPNLHGSSRVVVLPAGVPAQLGVWRPRIEQGAIVITEGNSELAASFGIATGPPHIPVRQIRDVHDAQLHIVWEKTIDLPVYTVPQEWTVFARERWTGSPLVAGIRMGRGALLWLAVTPGAKGHERFPYIPQALVSLGLDAPFRSGRLWAFFDSSYRLRADPDYLAERWRAGGIGALHVAAWHYHEPDAQRDEYLRKLIAACHRRAILVYAWVELPHVSERFWNEHPEWREKTALVQDAQLDWRKLMNLANPECAKAVKTDLRNLAGRFDWDGINLAELYFESLEGIANPSRFTPFNDDVRRAFRELHGGVDPIAVTADPGHPLRPQLLDFRAALAQKLQEEWLRELSSYRRGKPHLDLVLTHVDDRFDTRMRDLIGAESARLLPLLSKYDFTFLIEDPATIWNLGPQRYPQIAEKYRPATPLQDRLAIDINVVERYQDVYPTKLQTGTELFQLVHLASGAFPRVALYFENSIRKVDWALLGSAAASVQRVEEVAGRLVVESKHGVGVPWSGPAKVNGRLWPVLDGRTLWLPPGGVAIEKSTEQPTLRVLDFNGELSSASATRLGTELSYSANHRAVAILDRRAGRVEVDGVSFEEAPLETAGRYAYLLPRGQHVVSFFVPESTLPGAQPNGRPESSGARPPSEAATLR